MKKIIHRRTGELEPKVVYEMRPGEQFYWVHTGSIIVVHPERPPKIIYFSDGRVEELKPWQE